MNPVSHVVVLLSCCILVMSKKLPTEAFIKAYNKRMLPLTHRTLEAMFSTAINMTEYNSMIVREANEKLTDQRRFLNRFFARVDTADDDVSTQRKLLLLRTKHYIASNAKIDKGLDTIRGIMGHIYHFAKTSIDSSKIRCMHIPSNSSTFEARKYLRLIMETSTDPDELAYAWKTWRDAISPYMKTYYSQLVRLSNIVARENKFEDAGDMKRKLYEVDNLETICESLWLDVKPFYEELHAYIRYRLMDVYPYLVVDGELLPDHILGDMWALKWDRIYKYVIPYPGEPSIDINPVLEKQYDVIDMFKVAEKFFLSLGWRELPHTFWKYSMFEKPKDRKVMCQASAWDLKMEKDGEPDVRVKMCAERNQDDFITIHHELGHIYYYMFYWNESLQYRDGANPGFHEAVGDTISLSALTPEYLYKLGLLKKVSHSPEADINFLMKIALERITSIPFALSMDKWMWSVYKGKTKTNEYNKYWWELKKKYQGLRPPVERSENDFDPGAKFHIATDTSYIRYFFSHILQFTFHKELCRYVNNGHALHRCSIYQSKEAGKAFGDMLALGKSLKWQEVLKRFTGSEEISVKPLLEYFRPLLIWLKIYRKRHKYSIGWK